MNYFDKIIGLTFVFTITFAGTIDSQKSSVIKIPASADKLINPIKGDKKASMQGARIYKKICWVCHGDNGSGNGPQAAELTTKPADFCSDTVINRTDGALFWWIENGGNDMQPYKEVLSDVEIWKTVNYVRLTQNSP